MVLWTSAGGDYGQISSGSDVAPFVEAGNLTQTGQVAKGDTVVHQIEVTGVYGAVQAELDADADNATVALTNVLSDDGVDLTMVQTNPSANQDKKVLDLAATPASAINVVADSDNGTLYVNVDTSEAVFDQTDDDDFEPGNEAGSSSIGESYSATSSDVDLEDGDEFNVTFFVGDESALTDDNEAVSAQFEVTDRTASFDSSQETADNEPLVTTQNAAGQTVSGTTSVAPGTNVTVRARATGDSPFLKTQEVEVQPDGTFAATLDFSDVSTGTNFTLTVPNQGFEDNVETDGRVAPKPTASVSISDQTTDGTTVTVDSASLSNGGFVTIHDGSLANGAVFDSVRGTSAYLEAGSHSDIEVSLDAPYESDGAAIAMPHQDTNGNEAYDFVSSDGAEDGPYTADGAAVTDDASLTVETTTEETPTPTPSPSPTPTPDEETPTPTEDTPTPTDTEGQPGFGAALAIVALAGAALLALRRE
jgi:PGF-CTERM protein